MGAWPVYYVWPMPSHFIFEHSQGWLTLANHHTAHWPRRSVTWPESVGWRCSGFYSSDPDTAMHTGICETELLHIRWMILKLVLVTDGWGISSGTGLRCHSTSLTISQLWFKWWLGAVRQQAIAWANVDSWARSLSSYGIKRPQCVYTPQDTIFHMFDSYFYICKHLILITLSQSFLWALFFGHTLILRVTLFP